jgi:hypothetical protein
MTNILKKLHDTFIEDDAPAAPEPAKSQSQNRNPNPSSQVDWGAGMPPTGYVPPASSPFLVPGSTVLDEAVYQRVLQKTDFDQTDVGRTIHKYYDALPDEESNQRFKRALAQATKLEGLTPDRVLAAFDGLKAALQQEGDRFAKNCDTRTQNEVTARQQRIQDISDQIAKLTQQIGDLQTQHTQISGELVEAQGKITNAQTQFQLAATRRSQEIDQQKAQFAALLK